MLLLTQGMVLVHLDGPAAMSPVYWHFDHFSILWVLRQRAHVSSTPFGRKHHFLNRVQAETGPSL